MNPTAAAFVPAPHSYAAATGSQPMLVTVPALTRIFATVVDWLLGAGSLAGALLGGFAGLCVSGLFPAATDIGLEAGSLLGLLAIWLLQVYLVSTTGQTITKRWYGIRIVRTDGSPAGFVHGWLLRGALLRVIDFVTAILVLPYLIFWIVNVCMLGTANGRTLHDRLAGTRVVLA